MRTQLTAVTLIAGIVLSSAALAGRGPEGPGRGPHGGPHGGPFMHELRDLDLSDAQREQIKGFFDARREQNKASFKAARDLHRSFELATPGTAEYRTLTAQMADASAAEARERTLEMAELRTQIYGVLTDAQRKELAQELAHRPEPPKPRED